MKNIDPLFCGHSSAFCSSFFLSSKPPEPNSDSKASSVISVIIDGTNLLHGMSNGKTLSLLNVLGLVIELNNRKIAFKCFFDANTFFTLLGAGKKAEAYAYRRLCYDLSDQFVEVPGRNRADDFLLDYVNKGNETIISNDQYRDFASKYAWLAKDSGRRVSFLVHSALMQVVALGLSAAIPTNLAESESLLRNQIGRITGKYVPVNLPPQPAKTMPTPIKRSFAPAH